MSAGPCNFCKDDGMPAPGCPVCKTEREPTLLDIAKELIEKRKKATQGEWKMTLAEPEGFPGIYLDAEKNVDFTYDDMNLMDFAANHAAFLAQAYIDLTTRLEEAEAVVRFYGDYATWADILSGSGVRFPEDKRYVPGFKAREYLKKYGGGK